MRCGVSIVPKNDFYLRLFALTPRRKWLHKKGTRRQGGEETLFCRFVDEREREREREVRGRVGFLCAKKTLMEF